jgi:hypothetical protein
MIDKLLNFYNKRSHDLELAIESPDNLYAICGDFETFLSNFLADSVALEELSKKEIAPILEEGDASYKQCMQILAACTAEAEVKS